MTNLGGLALLTIPGKLKYYLVKSDALYWNSTTFDDIK